MLNKRILLSLLLVTISFCSFSQTKASYMSAGDKAFAKEDYSSAMHFYLQSLEFAEDDAYISMRIGECNRRMFEYKTALAWLDKCIAVDKEHQYMSSMLYKAETLKCMAEFEKARIAVSSYLAIDSSQNKSMADLYLKRINNAEEITKNSGDTILLVSCGKNVNTAFSDFAATYVNDHTMLFSSLRFETTGTKNKAIVSKILTATFDSVSVNKPKLLEDVINNPSWHNCNASVTPDEKVMVFSRCNYNSDNKLICALYESRLINGHWQEPQRLGDEINHTGYTSTQPCITSAGIEGYILYFVSDRPGGAGLTDIYRSKRDARGNYSKPDNCGKKINTTGNEFSPFYNANTHELFFSSDSLEGLGGLDIYIINPDDEKAHTLNIGLPFNSGYNDLYFSLNLNQPSNGFLSSNRPGTMELNGQTCCYDIFRFSPSQKRTVQELEAITKVPPVPVIPREANTETPNIPLQVFLPLKLYFDNDYPDPRSINTTTKADYESLYENYFSKLELFIDGYKQNKSLSAEEERAAIEQFFASDLQYNYRQLQKFSDRILLELIAGNSVDISIRGCASPLAESGYNLILSKRRINSMVNFWLKWQNGAMKDYLNSSKMKITEEAAGETLSAAVISDKLNDLANSVYNPVASRERKIEIVSVKVSHQ